MQFNKLQVKNFRNIENIEIDFSPGVNIFVGNNGEGKTNLLESLYFALRGQSFRPGKTIDLINKKSLLQKNSSKVHLTSLLNVSVTYWSNKCYAKKAFAVEFPQIKISSIGIALTRVFSLSGHR